MCKRITCNAFTHSLNRANMPPVVVEPTTFTHAAHPIAQLPKDPILTLACGGSGAGIPGGRECQNGKGGNGEMVASIPIFHFVPISFFIFILFSFSRIRRNVLLGDTDVHFRKFRNGLG